MMSAGIECDAPVVSPGLRDAAPSAASVQSSPSGTVASTADTWNRLYYGRAVSPPDILIRESVRNKQAKELINVVAAAAKKT